MGNLNDIKKLEYYNASHPVFMNVSPFMYCMFSTKNREHLLQHERVDSVVVETLTRVKKHERCNVTFSTLKAIL